MKAIKIRIYPTSEQIKFLNQQFGAVRKTYNMGIAIMRNRYKRHGQSLSAYHDLKKLLPIAKRSRKYYWLKSFDSTSLQQALINLDKSFKRFFKKQGGYPKFKSKHGKQSSYHCSAGIGYGEDWIRIGKLDARIKAKIHRKISGRISSITIARHCSGKYYASLVFPDQLAKQMDAIQSITPSKVIGLDVGLSHLLIDSNHRKTDNPRFLKNAMRNLRCKQKKLSRKQKGSVSRKRARLLVAKTHEKLFNSRNDFQHKLSKTMVDENQAIIVETLKVKNMLKNRKLSKHIADAAWSCLLEKIAYKAKQLGKHYKKIDQWFASSKTCHCCGATIDTLALNIRHWQCQNCQVDHDRDINAAMNIKKQGLILLKAEGLSVSAD